MLFIIAFLYNLGLKGFIPLIIIRNINIINRFKELLYNL